MRYEGKGEGMLRENNEGDYLVGGRKEMSGKAP